MGEYSVPMGNGSCRFRTADSTHHYPICVAEMSSNMHDLLIATAFLAMLVFPCLTALRNDVPSDDTN